MPIAGITASQMKVSAAPVITTTVLNPITQLQAFAQTLVATGATPITWSVVAGTLPGGLALHPTTGQLSGNPTLGGAYSFTVRATNASGADDQAYSGTVIQTRWEIAPVVYGYVVGVTSPDLQQAKGLGGAAGNMAAPAVLSEHIFTDLEGSKFRYIAAFCSFDTSFLNGKTISQAQLQIIVTGIPTGTGALGQLRAYNFGPSVDVSDFHVPTETLLASQDISFAGGKTFTTSPAFVAAINKTGLTYLMITTPSQVNGAPAEAQNVSAQSNFNIVTLNVIIVP